jgi:RNA polymerase sigma-70 factor, ECF subfamily
MFTHTMSLEYSLVGSSPMPPSAEAALLQSLRDGRVSAVGEAYDLHHEAIRRFALRLIGDSGAAEDLVQEVFMALPAAIARFRGESSLRTFLTAIAIHHCRRHVRSASRRRNLGERVLQSVPPSTPATDPERELYRKQLAQALARALDELSLDHRVTFVLCEVEKRTSPEVAEILGIPEATVRTRLFFAKKKLRTLLEGA